VGDLGCRLGLEILWCIFSAYMACYRDEYILWESGRIQGFASNIIVGYTGFGFEDDGLIE